MFLKSKERKFSCLEGKEGFFLAAWLGKERGDNRLLLRYG